MNCSKCRRRPRRPSRNREQSLCLKCHAAYARAHRKRWENPESRRRSNARAYLRAYLRRGKIVKGPCRVCGKKKVEAHHENYDRPLDVWWFCRPHHLDFHHVEQKRK